jgi:hypothetical protein
MFRNEKETQKLLKQLANKLSSSAHQLSEAARRLHLAELTYREYLVRLRKLDVQMRQLIDLLRGPAEDANGEPDTVPETNPTFCEAPPPPKRPQRKLRYADYIEFSNYAELKKFEQMGDITDAEVRKFDADDVMRSLLQNDPK